MRTKLLFIVILSIVLVSPVEARGKSPIYEVSIAVGCEKLCGEIKTILENPINKDFGDWSGAWNFKEEIATSAFNLPKGYNKIRWIKWEKIPLKDIHKYMDDSEWVNRVLGKSVGNNEIPSALEKAIIFFPIEGEKHLQPITMLRIIDSDSRYNQQRCHVPIASRKYLSKESWQHMNKMGSETFPWCNFFPYHGKIYHANWMYAGNYQYEIRGPVYINKQKKLTFPIITCAFNSGD